MPVIVAAVKDDIGRHRIRERLQVLEAWKLDAWPVELALINALEDYLKDALEPDEERACDDPHHEDYKQQDAEDRERAYPTRTA